MSFSGFVAEDFAAYEEQKWSSNVYTLERMKVKDKLQSLVGVIRDELTAEQLLGLEWAFSDEYPTIVNNKTVDKQWGYAFRDEKDRQSLRRFLEKTKLTAEGIFNLADYTKHATIALVLEEKGFATTLHIGEQASIDRSNFAARLTKPWDRDVYLERISTVEPQAVLSIGEQQRPFVDQDVPFTEELAKLILNEDRSIEIGWFDKAEDVLSQGVEYGALIAARFKSLLPIYRYLAWCKDNDHIDVQAQLERVQKKAKRVQGGIEVGRKVKITGGLFSGKHGKVLSIDGRGNAKVSVSGLGINVQLKDCQPAQ